ncbi:MAG TPA: type II toxin-antitoxin system RelE/ParE family toxin [Pinirhizobacter sp.]|uniref:type II toxin-antitoxin system RelE/ParE family toxin n=1 Tax=Pinirhizobacter sp. TaxID=2950432 RepID=UPI002C9C5BA1|nr:type II toxin-antitoxin system RelE/ParE family toxin [Pinirhizobacter sp.]HMH67159.1 type II toxin-antitoxin system RelE/ParE family toxin [Pinirhizobacter sp.]
MTARKHVCFMGSALDDLRTFPESARRQAGHQIDRLQNGLQPNDFKPMPTIGRGVEEIRVKDDSGAYRIIYIARLAHAVYVLHCFKKKSQKTSRPDLDLAASRYRDVIKDLSP